MGGVYNRFSLLFFSILFLMLGNLQTISGLFRDRQLFYRERASGLYHTWPYFSASSLVYLPMLVMSTMVYGVLVYYLTGFTREPEAFCFFILTCFLVNAIGYSWAQFLAAASLSQEFAFTLFPMSFIFFNTFAGFLIHVPQVPSYWQWACDISFVRWAIQGVVINEIAPHPQLRYYAGSDVLGVYGYSGYNKWTSIIVLLGLLVVVRLLTFVVLSYKRHGTTWYQRTRLIMCNGDILDDM